MIFTTESRRVCVCNSDSKSTHYSTSTWRTDDQKWHGEGTTAWTIISDGVTARARFEQSRYLIKAGVLRKRYSIASEPWTLRAALPKQVVENMCLTLDAFGPIDVDQCVTLDSFHTAWAPCHRGLFVTDLQHVSLSHTPSLISFACTEFVITSLQSSFSALALPRFCIGV